MLPNTGKPANKHAVISVAKKDKDLVDFALRLIALGWRLISSGGTADFLRSSGIAVQTVAELRSEIFCSKMELLGWKITRKMKSGRRRNISLTGAFGVLFPTQMLGHRVATLCPEVHGGILAAEEMMAELAGYGYPKIDLVVVDLYDLESAIKEAGTNRDQLRSVLNAIDIGGAAMLTGTSKNLGIAVSCIEDRKLVIEMLEQQGDVDQTTRLRLAADTFARVAQNRLFAAEYLSRGQITGQIVRKHKLLKYGENQNQSPAWFAIEFDYTRRPSDELGLPHFTHIQGAEPSYNNIAEVSRNLHTLCHLVRNLEVNVRGEHQHAAIGTKHGNPCGMGVNSEKLKALQLMLDGDPLAIHGGVVCVNFGIGIEEANVLMHYGMPEGQIRLLDCIAAAHYTAEAKEVLKRKGENKLRLLANPKLNIVSSSSMDRANRWLQVRGGWLIQPAYSNTLDLTRPQEFEQLFVPQLDTAALLDLSIAQAASHTSNSNTIAMALNSKLIGNGVGQQSRIAAAELAISNALRSGHSIKGAKVSSDSFFPFPDAVLKLIERRVGLILSTSGSLTGDNEIRKLLLNLNNAANPFPVPGVILLDDKSNRGFCHHSG